MELNITNRNVDLVAEGFDLAIRVGPLADSNLTARKLGDLHYGLFAAPAYLTRRGVVWMDDPSNDNDRFQRVKARRALKALKPLGITVERLADSVVRDHLILQYLFFVT